MTKFDEKFKISVVEQYLSGTDGCAIVGRRNGVSTTMVTRWVASYQKHGIAGLRKKFQHYDAQFRLRVLRQMWKKQWSYQETGLAFGIRSQGCVAVWERCYHNGGIDALQPRKRGRPPRMPHSPVTPLPSSVNDETRSREDLLAEINQLRMENAYLKKLEALVQAQKQQRATTRGNRK
ncbi:Transposase IS3 family, part 1 [Herminiimonas arsenicoxydans]|uniref:Transposase IS3 family, part 1 n=1 Tax=Herminiimonas arsenicoxydans TaxID=204773 RepID=A4G204_HERAR|nr:Transposase IS3 family, part 1 [Herminiimonas arsenicoxydans]CAL60719.1 Transposase IS3 family, part 1 [Herminiimonas arsenicoxydans]